MKIYITLSYSAATEWSNLINCEQEMVGLSRGGDAGGHALSLPATTGDEEFIVLLAQTGTDTDSNQINNKPRWWLQ